MYHVFIFIQLILSDLEKDSLIFFIKVISILLCERERPIIVFSSKHYFELSFFIALFGCFLNFMNSKFNFDAVA
jgi:hypothetical protein